jgi:hypothetical protein
MLSHLQDGPVGPSLVRPQNLTFRATAEPFLASRKKTKSQPQSPCHYRVGAQMQQQAREAPTP